MGSMDIGIVAIITIVCAIFSIFATKLYIRLIDHEKETENEG